MARWTFSCWSCGETAEMDDRIVRSDACPGCDSDMHSCLNCRHFDRSASNECRETMADYVYNKERANFCGYFEARPASIEASTDEAEAARARLEALFNFKK